MLLFLLVWRSGRDPQSQSSASALLEEFLIARGESVSTLAFDVDGSDHGSAFRMYDGDDDFRERAAEGGQVALIGSNIADDNGCLFLNGHGCQSIADGETRISRRPKPAGSSGAVD